MKDSNNKNKKAMLLQEKSKEIKQMCEYLGLANNKTDLLSKYRMREREFLVNVYDEDETMKNFGFELRIDEDCIARKVDYQYLKNKGEQYIREEILYIHAALIECIDHIYYDKDKFTMSNNDCFDIISTVHKYIKALKQLHVEHHPNLAIEFDILLNTVKQIYFSKEYQNMDLEEKRVS